MEGCLLINIAICDNNLNICSNLVNYVHMHFHTFINIVDDFTNGAELLDSIYNGEIYNIIVLSDTMSPLDGITTGNIIRTHPTHKNSLIIFISSNANQMSAIMDIHPFALIHKPIDINFFHSSLNAAMNTLKERLGHITLTQKGGHVNVNINDIFYIESDNPGKCIVNFENTSITHHGTMSSLNSEISISGHNFVRVHTSYTVNPLHLKCFNSSILQLSNGVSVPVGKSYRSCFMKKCKNSHVF